MLVWLASYPRSGNTLLRQVLKACFDLPSCEGLEPVDADLLDAHAVRGEFYGSYFVDGDPEAFYRRARTDPGLVLVKTHHLPRDGEKAIYVVRDGRLAVKSFVRFQDTYHPGSASFGSLLVGDHRYGDWTAHHRAWCERGGGETLVVRFEELVAADAALLARLAAFLGRPGPVRPWVNPHAQLRQLDPAFFGTGARAWRPDPFWTAVRLRQFYTLHGPLLARLGYATAAEVEAGAYPDDSDEARLVRFVAALAAHWAALRRGRRPADESADEAAARAELCAVRDRVFCEFAYRSKGRIRLYRQLDAAAARIQELNQHCLRLERQLWWRRLPLFGTVRQFIRRARQLLPAGGAGVRA
jgi:hypothetical protein